MAWEKMKRTKLHPIPKGDLDKLIKRMQTHNPEMSSKDIKKILKEERKFPVWVNNTYQASLRKSSSNAMEAVDHLSIKRIDKEPTRDWRDLQNIKNDICGEEREAVEMFPAESRRVDSANQYHLWVFKKGIRIPFGFEQRAVDFNEDRDDGTKQRGI